MKMNSYADMAELGGLYPGHVKTIKARHDRALDKAGAGHAVIFSGAPKLVFLDDYHYPFKANPHFIGWLPLTHTPFCYL
ncbi:MAG: Xaa-Pro dipeptidase, partial [Woeseiaceae bacterium]